MNKLIALAWYWHIIILLTIGIVLFVAVRYTVTGDIYTQATAVEEQIVPIKQKNEQARIATERIDTFRALFQTKNAEYDELKVLLPEKTEITNVLKGLQDTTHSSGLIMKVFKPSDNDTQQGFITHRQVEVEVVSNYSNLRNFFTQMAKLQRIVSISNVNVTQLEKQTADKTLNSKFNLMAYYATPEAELAAAQVPCAPPGPCAPPVPGQQPPVPGQQPPVPGAPPAPNGQPAPPQAPPIVK